MKGAKQKQSICCTVQAAFNLIAVPYSMTANGMDAYDIAIVAFISLFYCETGSLRGKREEVAMNTLSFFVQRFGGCSSVPPATLRFNYLFLNNLYITATTIEIHYPYHLDPLHHQLTHRYSQRNALSHHAHLPKNNRLFRCAHWSIRRRC